MSSPDLEAQFTALRQAYAERLPVRAETLAAIAAGLVLRWDAAAASELKRQLHNLAGSGASYGFPDISHAARAAEDACGLALDGGPTPALTPLTAALEALAIAIARVRA